MTTKSKRWGVLIGRFQPFHCGHRALLNRMLSEVEQVLVIVGSSFAARRLHNPWSLGERQAMIRAGLEAQHQTRVHICGIPDVYYADGDWVRLVRDAVAEYVPRGAQIRLYGHTKDASSYYLDLFPHWDYVELPDYRGLSATPLREQLLSCAGTQEAKDLLTKQRQLEQLPSGVGDWLESFVEHADFAELLAEAASIRHFQQTWASSPYPPVFVTTDALVLWRDEVLLIQRGRRPGLGLWAMPGGFLDPQERLEAGCRRELHEETGLQLPANVHALEHFVGDHPDRSDRGRFVTHVFAYRLDAHQRRPQVRGADDAARARWWPVDTLDPERMFEDHALLIEHLLPNLRAGRS